MKCIIWINQSPTQSPNVNDNVLQKFLKFIVIKWLPIKLVPQTPTIEITKAFFSIGDVFYTFALNYDFSCRLSWFHLKYQSLLLKLDHYYYTTNHFNSTQHLIDMTCNKLDHVHWIKNIDTHKLPCN